MRILHEFWVRSAIPDGAKSLFKVASPHRGAAATPIDLTDRTQNIFFWPSALADRTRNSCRVRLWHIPTRPDHRQAPRRSRMVRRRARAKTVGSRYLAESSTEFLFLLRRSHTTNSASRDDSNGWGRTLPVHYV